MQLGANPASEHAHKCLISATELVPAHTEVVDSFICQGAVDPKLIEMMYKRFPADSPHGKILKAKLAMLKRLSIRMKRTWRRHVLLQYA